MAWGLLFKGGFLMRPAFPSSGLQFAIVMLLCHMDFHDILMCDNLLYCTALFLELCAMVKLRVSQVTKPDASTWPRKRPALAVAS